MYLQKPYHKKLLVFMQHITANEKYNIVTAYL